MWKSVSALGRCSHAMGLLLIMSVAAIQTLATGSTPVSHKTRGRDSALGQMPHDIRRMRSIEPYNHFLCGGITFMFDLVFSYFWRFEGLE
jgi:hypothetical protein